MKDLEGERRISFNLFQTVKLKEELDDISLLFHLALKTVCSMMTCEQSTKDVGSRSS